MSWQYNGLQGAKIYVRYFPCNECAKAIIQSGIKEVIYSHSYDYDNHTDEMEASIKMFNECAVRYRKFDSSKCEKIVLSLND